MATITTRRAFLAASLPAVAAVALAAPALSARADANPDAELLAAWRDYVQAMADYDNLPPMKEAELAPWSDRLNRCRDRMETIPALTMEGMGLKLRYLLASIAEHPSADDALIHGGPLTDEFLNRVNGDFREAMLWRMIGQLEARGGAGVMA